jgi:hypothetical protein
VPGGFTNPFEYREMMYKMFFLGELPDGSEAATKAKVASAKKDIEAARERKKAGAAPARLDARSEREMRGLAAQIAAARAKRDAPSD